MARLIRKPVIEEINVVSNTRPQQGMHRRHTHHPRRLEHLAQCIRVSETPQVGSNKQSNRLDIIKQTPQQKGMKTRDAHFRSGEAIARTSIASTSMASITKNQRAFATF